MNDMDFNSLIFLYKNDRNSSSKDSLAPKEKKFLFKNVKCSHEEKQVFLDYFSPELHLNIWEPENGSKCKCYLDIGLMLPIKEYTNKMTLILPWDIEKCDLIDLSGELMGNAELQAIFNDSYSFTNRSHDGGHIARHMFTPDKFFNIISASHNYIHLSKKNNCSYLDIDIKELRQTSARIDEASRKKADRMYIRFRILKMPEAFYCRTITPKDSIYQSSITVSQIIDVRVNVRRDIPVNLLSELSLPDMEFVSFNKIHLFLMKPQEDDITFMDRYFKSCRSLENARYWAKYSNRQFDSITSNLGYQWTRKCDDPKEDDGWTVLARFTRIKFTMKRYIAFFMIAGVIGGILGNLIYNNYDIIIDTIFVSSPTFVSDRLSEGVN